LQMYFESCIKRREACGRNFKNFNLFIYGVNYEPYRAKFENLIGRKVDIELFPASDFFAYQDTQKEKECCCCWTPNFLWIYKSDEFYTENQTIYIGEVALGELCFDNFYQCGTLGYNIGDTVQFTSLKPYRIIVSGRIKHYISAFDVIGKEVKCFASHYWYYSN
jgi:hypothetical protein